MFDINPLDTRPGEAELLAVGAAYFANRLLSRGHRRQIEIAINITTQPMRVPIPRSMLSTNDGVLRRKLPQNFAFSVSVASGMRNAMELIAHEIIHIAQVLYRRLIITWRILPQRMSDRVVYQARWENGRAMPMGQLEWAVRPWEIEASRWQSILVDEFLAYSTGQLHSLPLQRPRKSQLALFDIGRDATPPPRVNAVSSLARISQMPPFDSGTSVQTESQMGQNDPRGEAKLLPSPRIRVDVSGLPAPRVLTLDAIRQKRQELGSRGLIR